MRAPPSTAADTVCICAQLPAASIPAARRQSSAVCHSCSTCACREWAAACQARFAAGTASAEELAQLQEAAGQFQWGPHSLSDSLGDWQPRLKQAASWLTQVRLARQAAGIGLASSQRPPFCWLALAGGLLSSGPRCRELCVQRLRAGCWSWACWPLVQCAVCGQLTSSAVLDALGQARLHAAAGGRGWWPGAAAGWAARRWCPAPGPMAQADARLASAAVPAALADDGLRVPAWTGFRPRRTQGLGGDGPALRAGGCRWLPGPGTSPSWQRWRRLRGRRCPCPPCLAGPSCWRAALLRAPGLPLPASPRTTCSRCVPCPRHCWRSDGGASLAASRPLTATHLAGCGCAWRHGSATCIGCWQSLVARQLTGLGISWCVPAQASVQELEAQCAEAQALPVLVPELGVSPGMLCMLCRAQALHCPPTPPPPLNTPMVSPARCACVNAGMRPAVCPGQAAHQWRAPAGSPGEAGQVPGAGGRHPQVPAACRGQQVAQPHARA